MGDAGHLNLTVRYDEDDERITVKTNAVGVPAHFRLPLDLGARFKSAAWNGQPVAAKVEEGLECAFIRVDHALDGGVLTVQLDPHPWKGKGTTHSVKPWDQNTLKGG